MEIKVKKEKEPELKLKKEAQVMVHKKNPILSAKEKKLSFPSKPVADLRTVEGIVFQSSIVSNPITGFVAANRTAYPFSCFHSHTPYSRCNHSNITLLIGSFFIR